MDLEKKLELLKKLYVVMVEPRNPGNIGASVRAMKNMGVPNLRLINPVEYKDSIQQKKMGYRAQEITEMSKEFDTLEDAVADTSLVFLATCKKGKWKQDFLLPEQAAEIIAERIQKEKIAMVFGREDSGVTIDESQVADYYIQIPMAGGYPSLNLSQAILVVLYEIFKKVAEVPPMTLPGTARKKSFDRLFDNIWLLVKGLLIKEPEKGLFYRSLRRALNRTRWTNADIAVFDRACKQTRWFVTHKTKEDFVDEYDPRVKK